MSIDPQAPDGGRDQTGTTPMRYRPGPDPTQAGPDDGLRPSLFPDPLQWWLDRRRRKRQDPNPYAKGRPYRRPPLWQRLFSIIALLLIAVVFGLILTAAIVLVVAALALVLQSAIGS